MTTKGISYSGIFMLAFLFCAFCSSIYAIWNIRDKNEAITLSNFFNGTWSTAYEKQFDQGVHFHENSKAMLGILNFSLFKEGRRGVLIGKDGWLFTSEEFDYPRDGDKNLQQNLNYVFDVKDLLKSKNIDLIVALIPAKARIYNNKTGRHQWPEQKEKIYHNVRSALKANDIAVTDIEWLFSEKKSEFDIFLKTDTHWTPTGAKMAARSIASEIEKEFTLPDNTNTKFVTDRGRITQYEGDLLRYIPLGDAQDRFGPRKDRFKEAKTEKVFINSSASLENNLFGQENLPIALVGTSYSANSTWNFEGFLKEAIGNDILNAADEGLGPFETMQNYINDNAFKQTPPKLVIWEIPERFMTFNYKLDTIS